MQMLNVAFSTSAENSTDVQSSFISIYLQGQYDSQWEQGTSVLTLSSNPTFLFVQNKPGSIAKDGESYVNNKELELPKTLTILYLIGR